jgi:putative Mg2+ transporter-C (MgtC) family protein
MLHDLNVYVVGRLLLAALLGGIVGLERELSRKPAGLRTNMFISLGAALFTIISYELAGNVTGDHTRIAAQIIPGIGFIGAGVVIRERGTVIGITSAATLFVVASVGMAAGAGLPVTAIFMTLLILTALVALGLLENRLGLHLRIMNFRVAATNAANILERVRQIVHDTGIEARRWHSQNADGALSVEFEAEVTFPQERTLLARLGALDAHCEARPVQLVKSL